MAWQAVLVFVVLSAAGCWYEPRQAIDLAVWSDDDSKQVYVHSRWEIESGLLGVTEGASTRGLRSRVLAQAAAGGGVRELLAEQDDLGVVGVYHMVAHGYTVLALQVDGKLRLVRLAASGEQQVIAEPGPFMALCSWADAIPSPDGATIALIQRSQPPTPTNVPGPVRAGCEPGEVEVRLLDAATLQLQAGPFTWSVDDDVAVTWTPANTFHVVGAGQAWRVDPVDGALLAAAPRCTYPRTTSSDVSETGEKIGPGDEAQPVRVVQTGVAAFGCQ